MTARRGFLFSALVAAAISPVVAQSSSEDSQIVVLAHKLKDVKVKGRIKKENGVKTLTFRIVKSTGDAYVDSLVLQAANECGEQIPLDVRGADRAKINSECVKRTVERLYAPRQGDVAP